MKKILNGLECRAENRPPHCDKCQYKTKFAGHNICDFAQICKDVLVLLKEQEKQPKRTRKNETYDDWSGAQGNDGKRIEEQAKRSEWGIYG